MFPIADPLGGGLLPFPGPDGPLPFSGPDEPFNPSGPGPDGPLGFGPNPLGPESFGLDPFGPDPFFFGSEPLVSGVNQSPVPDVNQSQISAGTTATTPPTLSGLSGSDGFRVNGLATSDSLGRVVNVAGDINDDGFADVLVGAPSDDTGANGAAFLINGASSFLATFNLSSLAGLNGARFNGESANADTGLSVSGIGDINGDNIPDLFIGDPDSGSAGDTSVIFGASNFTSPDTLDSGLLDGSAGFSLDGVSSNYDIGQSLSAGDFNGDGFDEIFVGDPKTEAFSPKPGSSYVIFGKTSPFGLSVDLSFLSSSVGFELTGPSDEDRSGFSVSSAGDINGDGFEELLIGAPRDDPNGTSSGSVSLVFGNNSTNTTVALSSLSASLGTQFRGAAAGNETGLSVAGIGDFNGDGFDDIIIGADKAASGGTNRGQASVIFGRDTSSNSFGTSNTLDSNFLNGTNGFGIKGLNDNGYLGRSVSSAGDVNGDGFDDLIIGAPGLGSSSPGNQNGYAVIVFGGRNVGSSGEFDLSTLNNTNGFRLAGLNSFDYTGNSVSGGDDINGDGFDDVIIGAKGNDTGGNNAGTAFIVFGANFSGSVTAQGSSAANTINGSSANDVFIGGLGNDILVGGGGVDVLRGGAGDDTLVISDTNFRKIDGGTESASSTTGDTLRVDAGNLDLSTLANNRIEGIESIDLGGSSSGANTLTLQITDVLNLSETSNTVVIFGSTAQGDSVSTPGESWSSSGTQTIDNQAFNVFTLNNATLIVDPLITDTTGITGA